MSVQCSADGFISGVVERPFYVTKVPLGCLSLIEHLLSSIDESIEGRLIEFPSLVCMLVGMQFPKQFMNHGNEESPFSNHSE
jgi:hypothetical protein